MYATRPLSLYRKDPTILSEHPTESGFLVLTNEETEAEDTQFFGIFNDSRVRKVPFPQNKFVNVIYSTGDNSSEQHKVWFLPVLDQPLSSNRYYVIRAERKYKGQACTCSKEEDMTPCCFSNMVNDVKPSVLDPRNIYQQVEIIKRRHGFCAKSIAPDGYPPHFLRRKGWKVEKSSSFQCQLSEAGGLNFSLRMNLPEFNFPISDQVVLGKWYCPFVFVKEPKRPKEQMKNSLFYEMTLEQWWEEIYSYERENTETNMVSVSVKVRKQVNTLLGMEAWRDEISGAGDGIIWYTNVDNGGRSLGMSFVIDEKMRRIQELGGWIGGEERDVLVEKTEEFSGEKGWKRFSCFVLVERFTLKTMNGTMLLTCDFKHIQHTRSNWE